MASIKTITQDRYQLPGFYNLEDKNAHGADLIIETEDATYVCSCQKERFKPEVPIVDPTQETAIMMAYPIWSIKRVKKETIYLEPGNIEAQRTSIEYPDGNKDYIFMAAGVLTYTYKIPTL